MVRRILHALILTYGLVLTSGHKQAQAAATESRLKSVLFSNYYFPTRDADESEIQQIANSYWLVFDTKYDNRASFHAVLATTLYSESALRDRDQLRADVELREAYALFRQPNSELRIGQQIIPWGKADLINPTDFLTATDYTRLSPETAVPRVGAASFWWMWNPSSVTQVCEGQVGLRCRNVRRQEQPLPWTFHLVWTPVFPKSVVYDEVAKLPDFVTLQDPEAPKASLSGSEVALKTEYTGDGWDLGLSVFRGWNHLPQYTESARGLDASGNPELTVTPRFSQIVAGGMDLSWSPEDWVFVVEAAFIRTRNSGALDALTAPPRLELVAGVERELFRNLRMNVQGIWVHHPKFRDPRDEMDPVSQEIAAANAILMRYQYRNLPGATWRLTYDDLDSSWKFQLFAMNYFRGKDFYIQPKIIKKWTDFFTVTLGADHYGGPGNRVLSAQRSLNAVFTEIKYLF